MQTATKYKQFESNSFRFYVAAEHKMSLNMAYLFTSLKTDKV